MRRLLAAALAATAGLTLLAGPATASNTDVTFSVTGGNLTLSTDTTAQTLSPAAALLGGTTASGALPQVTVTDERATTVGWKTQVSSTSWVAPGPDGIAGTADDLTIAADQGTMWVSAGPTVVSGTVVPATLYASEGTGLAMSTAAQDFVTTTSLTGANEVVYTPSIAVTIANEVLAGTYTGTVTQTAL